MPPLCNSKSLPSATELFVVPLFTLFFVALFVRRITAAGANLGALSGFLAAAVVAFWNPLFDTERAISFTWINPLALLVGIPVGWIVSRLTYSPPNPSSPTTNAS